MNILKNLSYLMLGLILITGCSDDDDSTGNDPQGTENSNDYFPLSVGNIWDYENTLTINDEEPDQYEDLLTVASVDEGNYQLASSVNDALFGFTTGLLSSGTVRKDSNVVKFNGEIRYDLVGLQEVEVDINDATILNPSAADNQELFKQNGEQTFSLVIPNFPAIPTTINYEVRTEQTGSLSSYDVNGETYEDIKISTLYIQLRVDVDVAGVILPLLTEADVVTSTNYFAKDVGLIYSETTTSYRLNDQGIVIDGLVTEYDSTLIQALESYTAQDDQSDEED